MQTINVKGVVVDVQGQPVIGASVLEKGTTNGGVTDINGNFILNVKSGAILQISYIGYRNQEVKAEKTMKIVLREDTELLSEVVVVGYGTQKKENLTGRSEEHTSELQSRQYLVCRLLLEKKKQN